VVVACPERRSPLRLVLYVRTMVIRLVSSAYPMSITSNYKVPILDKLDSETRVHLEGK
jgi:hypothetical protein